MRHAGVKCWADSYDAIVSGRKRADVRTLDRDYLVGDIVELVRWDRERNHRTVGVCEVMITHVERNAGPLLLFGVQSRVMVPVACLSFVFLRADFRPPLGQSEYCRTGADAEEVTPRIVDAP
jgi:Domain of unknown function (DUF3850)